MFKSIKTKMLVSFSSAVLVLLLVFIYVVMSYSKAIVEEVSYAELEEMNKSYSNEFSIEMQRNYEISRNLAGLLGHNRSGNRSEVVNYLKEILDKNPQIVGTYALYDKNQFDGSDSKYAGQTSAGSNSEGMFTPYYNRLQGSEILEALEEKDIINSDFNILPRQKGDGVILEPYLFNNVLITSYVFPIKKDDRVVGIAGVDVTLDYIDKKVSDIKILNSGFACLVSNSGLFISDKTKENIGKVTLSQAAQTFNVPQLEEIAKGIKENRSGMVTTIDFATGNKMLLFYRPFGLAQWGMLILAPEHEILEGVSRLSNIMIFLSIGALLLLGAAIFFLADRFSKPLLQLGNAADEVAKGNFTIKVNVAGNDEIGRMAASFNLMVAKVKELMDETRQKGELAERAAREAETARNNAIRQEEYLAGSVEELMNKMERFSGGDMTVNVTATNNDSVGKLFNGFNKTVKTMHNTIGIVSDAIEATASSANQISSAAEEMSAGAQEQNEKTSEIAGAVEEMTRTILENSQNASLASDISKEASVSAKLGKDKVKATKEGIQKIVEASTQTASVVESLARKTEQIGEIASVINDIADQTNLLALNAAIEAARAGEQGRGFAVVADEVRKLAERTGTATKEIADTIKAIQTEAHDADNSMKAVKYNVEKGMSLTEEVSIALEEILEKSSRVSDVIIQLAASSEEQSAASEQISKNIEGISSVTQQTADGIHQMARAAEDLRHLTLNLQKIISQFNLAGHSMTA